MIRQLPPRCRRVIHFLKQQQTRQRQQEQSFSSRWSSSRWLSSSSSSSSSSSTLSIANGRASGVKYLVPSSSVASAPTRSSPSSCCAGRGLVAFVRGSRKGAAAATSRRRSLTTTLSRDKNGKTLKHGKQKIGRKERRAMEREEKRRQQKEARMKRKNVLSSKEISAASSALSSSTSTTSVTSDSTPLLYRLRTLITPMRYRFSPSSTSSSPSSTSSGLEKTRISYDREHVLSSLRRVPLWIALAGALVVWDEGRPFTFVRSTGPSMLPTIAPDGTDVWLVLTKTWTVSWWKYKLAPLFSSSSSSNFPFRRGDVIGFAHPDHARHVSCKRIVGLPGDVVKRYGEYVRLYVKQDPKRWGIVWPDRTKDDKDEDDKPSHHHHDWMDRSCKWDDVDYCHRDLEVEMDRTLVVPNGHVWIEADCPAMGIDSRHHGPIPVEWIKGRIIWRVWPMWFSASDPARYTDLRQRPHPIPLDPATLAQYNIHRVPRRDK